MDGRSNRRNKAAFSNFSGGCDGALVSCYVCNKMFFFHILKIYLILISQNLYHLTIALFIDNIFSIFSAFHCILIKFVLTQM